MYQVPVDAGSELHAIADIIGSILTIPVLVLLVRGIWFFAGMKSEIKNTGDSLRQTLESLAHLTQDLESRVRPMEKKVDLLWDGRNRRVKERREEDENHG